MVPRNSKINVRRQAALPQGQDCHPLTRVRKEINVARSVFPAVTFGNLHKFYDLPIIR
jgi:hypothetical protein